MKEINPKININKNNDLYTTADTSRQNFKKGFLLEESKIRQIYFLIVIYEIKENFKILPKASKLMYTLWKYVVEMIFNSIGKNVDSLFI